MSDGEQTTTEVTPSQAAAVGAAGARNIDPENQTPDEALVTAREDMHKEAQRLDIKLAPEAIDQIADTFIDKLKAMGAFRQSGSDTEETSQEAESEGENQSNSAPEENNPPPTQRSLASRFLREG